MAVPARVDTNFPSTNPLSGPSLGPRLASKEKPPNQTKPTNQPTMLELMLEPMLVDMTRHVGALLDYAPCFPGHVTACEVTRVTIMTQNSQSSTAVQYHTRDRASY
jgi:hypothetical protein